MHADADIAQRLRRGVEDVGEGATFTVSIPIRAQQNREAA